MKLSEAEELFKEIIDKTPSLHHKNYLIILPEASPLNINEGYEVIIRANPKLMDSDALETLHEIATRRKLEVAEGKESIMFYESSARAKKLKKALEDLNKL